MCCLEHSWLVACRNSSTVGVFCRECCMRMTMSAQETVFVSRANVLYTECKAERATRRSVNCKAAGSIHSTVSGRVHQARCASRTRQASYNFIAHTNNVMVRHNVVQCGACSGRTSAVLTALELDQVHGSSLAVSWQPTAPCLSVTSYSNTPTHIKVTLTAVLRAFSAPRETRAPVHNLETVGQKPSVQWTPVHPQFQQLREPQAKAM